MIATRHDAAIVFAALALLPLAIRSSRNITPFVLMAGPALTRLLLKPSSIPTRTRVERYRVNAALLAACAVICLGAVAAAWTMRAARLQWDPMSQGVIDAVQQCPGRLYNRFDDGGFVIWFVPEVPVFVDNRQDPYPLSFLQDHLHHEQSGAFEEVFDRFDLRCAFLPPESPTAVRLLASGWQLMARDSRWLVLQAP
jgi:hypothetical protein